MQLRGSLRVITILRKIVPQGGAQHPFFILRAQDLPGATQLLRTPVFTQIAQQRRQRVVMIKQRGVTQLQPLRQRLGGARRQV